MVNSLRSRKKRQTRQAIIDSANELFAIKGYNGTTINEITARANCAPRTYFQYFSSKEDLLLVGIDTFWNGFAEFLSARPAEQSAFEATKIWMLKIAKEYANGEHAHMRMVAEGVDASIRSRAKVHGNERMRTILIPALTKDLAAGPDDVMPRVLASLIVAIVDTYYEDAKVGSMDMASYVEQAFELLKIPSIA